MNKEKFMKTTKNFIIITVVLSVISLVFAQIMSPSCFGLPFFFYCSSFKGSSFIALNLLLDLLIIIVTSYFLVKGSGKK